ncbi:uncharacterized protein At4g37920, chloroplastic [Phalaenopsis equestris]|uniref:uncharacterized protein At4g37920, chloroplastic n=1 Tax=Phalaenopsis equestris TaxID=78828 RepID=UPI0009E271CA|nr:uncharacterized protein At4g37920, chloroplastic [Phalaenopsis equestris]
MEISHCLRHLKIHPRFNVRLTCSSDISGFSSRYGFCCLNLHGRNAVFPLRWISQSGTARRGGLCLVSFRSQCLSPTAVGDTAVETSVYAGDLSSKVSSAEEAILQGIGPGENGRIDSEYPTDDRMVKVCDKLIEVFLVDKPTPTDWRRLLAFSREWRNIRLHFFKHCQKRADLESNSEMKHLLFRLGRKLKEIDGDVQRHSELINAIKGAPDDISSIVAKQRKDFTKEFFVHLHTVVESYVDNPTEQNSLAKLGNDCLAAVQAYDIASESIQAVETAELKLQDIINSPSVAAACKKIDDLANNKQLDSALMLMLTKAWSAGKESNMMKSEVKDILYHLYKAAVGNMQRLVPKEIRILKYLLMIESSEEQLFALKDAFTPGAELEGKDVDCLYTTPEKLHTWISTVVDAYHFSREGTLIREARDLMNPKVIQKLENLKKLVQDHFL